MENYYSVRSEKKWFLFANDKVSFRNWNVVNNYRSFSDFRLHGNNKKTLFIEAHHGCIELFAAVVVAVNQESKNNDLKTLYNACIRADTQMCERSVRWMHASIEFQ